VRQQFHVSLETTIMGLARDASLEINVKDMRDLEASMSFLSRGRKVFISFLPKQTWVETEAACRATRKAGFDPVPHIPVRLLADPRALDHVVAGLVRGLIGGLAGPARLSTLFKFALRCGVGPSIRALDARPTAFTKLLGDHGPQNAMRSLAEAHSTGSSDFAGIHLFCFGGYLRTCEWLYRVAEGDFSLNTDDGFHIK